MLELANPKLLIAAWFEGVMICLKGFWASYYDFDDASILIPDSKFLFASLFSSLSTAPSCSIILADEMLLITLSVWNSYVFKWHTSGIILLILNYWPLKSFILLPFLEEGSPKLWYATLRLESSSFTDMTLISGAAVSPVTALLVSPPTVAPDVLCSPYFKSTAVGLWLNNCD